MSSELPKQFFCAFSGKLMNDPVLGINGLCYEKHAIMEQLQKQKNANTNEQFLPQYFIENIPLKSLLQIFQQQQKKYMNVYEQCLKLRKNVESLEKQNCILREKVQLQTKTEPFLGKVLNNQIVSVNEAYYDLAGKAISQLPDKIDIKLLSVFIEV